MGTSIHARVPEMKNLYKRFFFDEQYMVECKLKPNSNLPGHAYFQFLCQKFDELYVRYNNGVEGRRRQGNFRSGVTIERIPPPVPNYSDVQNGQWHYHSLQSIPLEFAQASKRSPDDFCPAVQLKKFVQKMGEPSIQCSHKLDGSVYVTDGNNTWQRIQESLADFVEKYLGKDLEHVARKFVENLYLKTISKSLKALEKSGIKIQPQQLISSQTGKLKITITKTKVPPALPWNGQVVQENKTIRMMNTCTVDNFLFFVHVLLGNRSDIHKFFSESGDPVFKCLLDVHCCFQNDQHAEGKLLWLKQFDQFKQVLSIDAFGTEDQYVYAKLRSTTSTVYTSKCSNEACPQPESVHTSGIVCYR
jgi:hypothetical protein